MKGYMESVKGKNILIPGGTGIIGTGIVKVLLQAGATVIVPSWNEEPICHLRNAVAYKERLYTPLANIDNLAGANELLSWIKVELKYLDAVLACNCDWWQGAPLLNVSLDTWQKVLNTGLTAHFILAKTFLPFLFKREKSSYLFINGMAGLKAVSNAGPMSISTAAEIMLKEVLNLENQDQQVRINILLIDIPALQSCSDSTQEGSLTTEDAGLYCAYLLSDSMYHIRGQTIFLNNKEQMQSLI